MVRIARRTAPEIPTDLDPGYAEPKANEPDKHAQRTFADWTPAQPSKGGEDVEVYSNCETVELFLNGKSLGAQPLPPDASPRTWKVPFQPGTLRAEAKNAGAVVATDELKTAGKPEKIVLSVDPGSLGTSFDDVSYVRATITDASGIEVPNADDLVSFAISGPGAIAAVDNGDNSSTEPFQAKERHAYQGHCFAIIRATAATGPITLTATAPGRAPATITIPTQASSPAPH
jgi:beta-galactosidase